jgi:hypothetical protein
MNYLTKWILFFLFAKAVISNPCKISQLKKTRGYIPEKTPTGSLLKIENFKGNIVLVYFWASFDKYSGFLFKKIKDWYIKYNRRGFEVIAVCLDNNLSDWLKNIEVFDISWMHHVSDLEGWQCKSLVDFKINSIPYFLLFDEAGSLTFQGGFDNIKEIENKLQFYFNETLKIFPQIAVNEIVLTKKVKFELLHPNGTVIFRGNANVLDISELPSGDYVIYAEGKKYPIKKMMRSNFIYVYPKRVLDVIKLSETAEYKLYNRRGIILAEGEGNLINVESLPEGLYYLWINGYVERVLKK